MKWEQRELEFRAWNGDSMCYQIGITEKRRAARHGDRRFEHLNVEYLSPIMQYTGVKDINGEKIFEGDIVRFKDHFGGTITSFVQYNVSATVFILLGLNEYYVLGNILKNSNVIIGNIFQNPELVKKYNLE